MLDVSSYFFENVVYPKQVASQRYVGLAGLYLFLFSFVVAFVPNTGTENREILPCGLSVSIAST